MVGRGGIYGDMHGDGQPVGAPHARKPKELMYYAPGAEQMVYLVWELTGDRPTLAVICTTDDDLKRYVTDDRKTWRSRPDPVFVEKVLTDHLYGANDMRIAANLIRRK